MIWKDTEWVTSVCWVICSSSTCLGLQLRTERHWARTCSEESRQILGQVGPLTRHISTTYHHLPPHTPSGKAQQGGGERETTILTPVSYQPRGGCSDFSSLLVGLQGGGLFPQPLPFNLSSEWSWRTTHRIHGRLQQVNLWHVPTSHICLGGKEEQDVTDDWLHCQGQELEALRRTWLCVYTRGKFPCPEDLLLFHKRPRCGYWLSRGKVNSHCWTEKQEYALRKGDDWQMTPFPHSCPK